MNWNISRIVLCLVAFAAPALAETAKLPTEGLESRIEFWTKVYTVYGANDNIIHDRYNVNLIYDVAADVDVAARTAGVRSSLLEIRATLDSPDTRSPEAQRFAAMIEAGGLPVSAQTLDELAANIHTQRGIKERFRDGVIRSGRYVESFRDVFRNAGLPDELALLPLVESSFTNARSSVGAAGIWQFMRSTGKLYLTVTSKVDERQDPMKATIAASRLLGDNYRALGAWPLAITAYNHGRGGMQRAQAAHGSDLPTIIKKYDGPTFGYASMNFYTEFIAAVQVYDNYPQYFGQLTLEVPDGVTQKKPAPQMAAVVKAPAPVKATPVMKATTAKYKVRTGDTLWEIAERFGTSIRDLMEKNKLRNPGIFAGQLLLIK